MSRDVKFFGMAGMSGSYGTTMKPVPSEEHLYIRLTGVSVVNGQNHYAWTAVSRTDGAKWSNLEVKGGPGYDPAFEFNEQSATIGLVYKAWRDASSGQLLFF